jgi:hypothetical protein
MDLEQLLAHLIHSPLTILEKYQVEEHIYKIFKLTFRRAVPENASVNANNNEIQDMGVDGLDLIITGVSGDADNDTSTNLVNIFSKWVQDGNTATGFTKGRYGLTLGNAPQWDVTPTSTYGYHIRSTNFKYIGEKRDLVEFTIALALGGDLETAI